MKLGLTGTIGSGKSTVLRALEERGFRTVDTDRLAREQLEEEEVKNSIRHRYGDAVFQKDGSIHRSSLAGVVFGDENELCWLEELLHPRIRERWTRLMEEDSQSPWVVEVPLLFEKRLETHFDYTLCVHCQRLIRWERLRQKGLSDSDIERRERRQISCGEKEKRADYVLTNSGTKSLLNEQIKLLTNRLGIGFTK